MNGYAHIRGPLLFSGDGWIQALKDNYPFLSLTASDKTTVLKPANGVFRVTNIWNDHNNLILNDKGILWVKQSYSLSDDRLKFNEQKLEYGLAQVVALEPKRYDRAEYEYNPETEELVVHPEKTTNEIGLVAQDVQKVIPEAVSIPEDENRELWAISYDAIIPVLVKAIQEQQAQIEELKNEIQAMKSEI